MQSFLGQRRLKLKAMVGLRKHIDEGGLFVPLLPGVHNFFWNPDTKLGDPLGYILQSQDPTQVPVKLGLPIWVATVVEVLSLGTRDVTTFGPTFVELFNKLPVGVDLEPKQTSLIAYLLESLVQSFERVERPALDGSVTVMEHEPEHQKQEQQVLADIRHLLEVTRKPAPTTKLGADFAVALAESEVHGLDSEAPSFLESARVITALALTRPDPDTSERRCAAMRLYMLNVLPRLAEMLSAKRDCPFCFAHGVSSAFACRAQIELRELSYGDQTKQHERLFRRWNNDVLQLLQPS